MKAEAAKLNEPATENLAWINVYVGSRHERYRWMQLPVKMTVNQNPGSDYKWNSFTYEVPEGVAERALGRIGKIETYSERFANELECVTFLNQKYDKQHVQKQIAELRGYISWQRERIKDWKPADLLPIKGAK